MGTQATASSLLSPPAPLLHDDPCCPRLLLHEDEGPSAPRGPGSSQRDIAVPTESRRAAWGSDRGREGEAMRHACCPRSPERWPPARDGPVGPRPEQEARTDGDGRASRTHVTPRASCSVSLCSARGLGSNGRHAAGSTRGGWEAKWVHVAWQPGSRGPRLGVAQSASRGPGHGRSPGARRPR